MTQLNPQPVFDSDVGVNPHNALITGGKLVFPGEDNGTQAYSWPLSEPVVPGLYHYRAVILSNVCDAPSPVKISVGLSFVLLYGTGTFEGNIPTDGTVQIISTICQESTAVIEIDSLTIDSPA